MLSSHSLENIHCKIIKSLKIDKSKNAYVTWGDYDSPAASESFDVGAAVIYNPKDSTMSINEEKQHLIISKPTKYIKCFISSSNEKESSNLNTFSTFIDHVNKVATEVY